MRFRLRTLLILSIFGPPILAGVWFTLPASAPAILWTAPGLIWFLVRWRALADAARRVKRTRLEAELDRSSPIDI
jgi:hypothetical protein